MPTTDIMSSLLISGISFKLNHGKEMSGQASGAIRVADLRDPYWGTPITCSVMDPDNVEAMSALIDAMIDKNDTFLVWNPARQYPRLDPDGTILGASTVQINSLPSTSTMSLKGLPASYVLSRGDMLGFIWSTTHYALHRIVEATVTANGSGVTPAFEVTPHIQPGAAVDTAVDLTRPPAEMMIVPGSFDPRQAGGQQASLSFEAMQVL